MYYCDESLFPADICLFKAAIEIPEKGVKYVQS